MLAAESSLSQEFKSHDGHLDPELQVTPPIPRASSEAIHQDVFGADGNLRFSGGWEVEPGAGMRC